MNEYNKRESMENQKNVFFDVFTDSSGKEEEYELCDHEYSARSKGYETCLFCGLSEKKLFLLLPEKGYEDRTIVQSKVKQTTDDLRVMVRSIFEDLIPKPSFSQITVENSLEKLLETCETYILPDGTPIKEGKRKHPFRVSARPEGLCAALLWRETLVHKLPITMAGFSRKIGVPRTTILGAFKQLDDYNARNFFQKLSSYYIIKERQ